MGCTDSSTTFKFSVKPQKKSWCAACLVAFSALSTECTRAAEGDDWVTAINASYPTRCAEEDNVYVKLMSRDIQRFRIEALHPGYIESLVSDRSAPDFSDCSFDGSGNAQDPVFRFTPKRMVLWESNELLVMGNTLERFWRSSVVDVSVSGVHRSNIHLIQVYLKDARQSEHPPEEFLVLYPTDGYWRLKPLPVSHLGSGAYGSSFLVGPIKETSRPVVDLLKVQFNPASRTFELNYQDGSHGSMKIVEINQQRAVLDYSHSRPSPADAPIVAIRSMYVAPDNADASQVFFHRRGERGLVSEDLMAFVRSEVKDIRVGRSTLSKHNASAPDMWFGGFESR
ncbi:hypothetical protein [Pseudomonas sp. Pf153]|uniref:hypothetical protein n=1 Tax=Pseudomonas sp. Pf153 TaxID=1699309 RepID=UPI000A9DDAF9|nr:hypothetical protein [Pseudomonas sp. Pf153]